MPLAMQQTPCSKAADKKGGGLFLCCRPVNDSNGNGGNWRVTADLYKANAAKVEQAPQIPRDQRRYRTAER